MNRSAKAIIHYLSGEKLTLRVEPPRSHKGSWSLIVDLNGTSHRESCIVY